MTNEQSSARPCIVFKVAQGEIKSDKNGKNYRLVTFEKPSAEVIEDPILGKITVEGQNISTSVNRYAESYLDGKPEVGFAAPLFNANKPGDGGAFMGDIVTRATDPYEIPLGDFISNPNGETRTVNSYKTVVFGDTRNKDAFELAVRTAFRNAGHPLTDEDRQLVADAIARREAKTNAMSALGSSRNPIVN